MKTPARPTPEKRTLRSSGAELHPEQYELNEAPLHRFAWNRREFLKRVGGGLAVLESVTKTCPATSFAAYGKDNRAWTSSAFKRSA